MNWPLLYRWVGSLPCVPLTTWGLCHLSHRQTQGLPVLWAEEHVQPRSAVPEQARYPPDHAKGTQMGRRHPHAWGGGVSCCAVCWICQHKGSRLSARSRDRQLLSGDFCREVLQLQPAMKLRASSACCSLRSARTLLSTYGSQDSSLLHRIRSKQPKRGANEVGFAASWYKNPTDPEKQMGARLWFLQSFFLGISID